MRKYQIKSLNKTDKEIILTIPKEEIKKQYQLSFEKLRQELTVEGFRKGKAPTEVAQKYLSKEKIYNDLINTLITKLYQEIITQEKLKPVVNPKIELIKAEENQDWEIKIILAEKPIIEIGDYKTVVKKIKAESKTEAIWVPGKEKQPQEKKEDQQQKLLNRILEEILKITKLEISELIIEEELNHRLTKLVDDVQKIGLTMESYLKSKNLTHEQIKNQFKKEIIETYKLEFALGEIADKENLKVEKEDLDKLFANIKDEKERQMAQANSYFYASILRKQKTLDFLLSL
jgi:trigger factor